MSHADRKSSGIDRMQPVLVDSEGQIWSVTSRFFWVRPPQPDGNIVDYAVSNLGFIHIWPVDGLSVVVALRPDRVDPKTMAAAFYAIADLRPVRVFIAATNTTKQGWELFKSVDRALNRIEQLVTAVRHSGIETQLLRIWGTLRPSDQARRRDAPRSVAFPRTYKAARRWCGGRVAAGERRQALRRRAKEAMLASSFAAPFLTRLVAVSSLSFSVPWV
jgi:hypothetical protein